MNEEIDDLPPLTILRCQIPELRIVNKKRILVYPHVDYDERTPPNAKKAELMCKTGGRTCPLAKTCLKLGHALNAPAGVWGGRTLVDGQEINQGGTNGK